jgi:hypothetical protein
MTITDFAVSRGIQSQTVSIYIRRHFEEFKGHTKKNGKSVELDEIALQILEEQYPLPAPVQVIEDTESRQELIKVQKLVIQLQEKLNNATMQIAQAEATKMLLEDKEHQLAKAEERAERMEKRAEEIKRELTQELDQVRLALETEKNKTWVDKLLKR